MTMGDEALKEELDAKLEEGNTAPAEDEVEIVLDRDEEQEEKPVVKKRNPIRDLRERNKELKKETKTLAERNAELEEELARRTNTPTPTPKSTPAVEVPDEAPTLANCGYDADEFTRKYSAWSDQNIEKKVQEHLKGQTDRERRESVTKKAEAAIESHYQRASELKVGNYEQMEDTAVDILGVELVQSIQTTVDNSETLLYWLGKNPEKTQELKELFDASPGKGTLELGKLSGKLTLKPKGGQPPNPDIPLRGGGGAQNSSAYNKFLKKLSTAYDNMDLEGARAVRQEAKEAGVTLPYNIT
jgi:hypothetical protein